MKRFSGIPASPGIAIGTVFLHKESQHQVVQLKIAAAAVGDEQERYRQAVAAAIDNLQRLRESADEDGRNMLEAHILLLQDKGFSEKIIKKIDGLRINAEWAILQVARDYIGRMEKIEDPLIRSRIQDIYDVGHLIQRQLTGNTRGIDDFEKKVILVAHNILPSDTIEMDKRMVQAIVADVGGKTSHTSILARSFELPSVVGLGDLSIQVKDGDEIIVDGFNGIVILSPSEQEKEEYRYKLGRIKERDVELLTLNKLAAESRDGKQFNLYSNIEVKEELDAVLSQGADGIGLYRSEFLYYQHNSVVDEQSQFENYRYILEGMEGKPVTIRTLDVGGDKQVPEMVMDEEDNPLLGCRAIRFSLARPEIFHTQLRALLRASIYGNLQIMFPMISGVDELRQVLRLFSEVQQELRSENISFVEQLPVGIMVETPAAALVSHTLATMVDFFSIGTNDLIQYSIAVDRGNEKIANLYQPFHPGVMRLLKIIIDSGHRAGIPVNMCGEMAGDPYATVFLMGMGLDGFSMSSASIPVIKKIIRSITVSQAEEMVGAVEHLDSNQEIVDFVQEWVDERFNFINLG